MRISEIPYLDESLHQYAISHLIEDPSVIFVVAFSGGKDSVAMVLFLLEKGVPRERIELHHHDVDGHGDWVFDWKVTPSYCRAFAKAMGMPIFFSYREGGIQREILRDNQLTGDVYYQQVDGGEYVCLPTTGGKPNTRMMFPAVAKDLQTRWCSAVVKIDVMRRVITNMPRYNDGSKKLVVCTGERAEESPNRAKYAAFDNKGYKASKKRDIIQWRPVLDMSEREVWDLLEKWSIQPHPAYVVGWGRCSCQTCIFNGDDYWATMQELWPDRIQKLVDLEIRTGFDMFSEKKQPLSVKTRADRGESFAELIDLDWVSICNGDFMLPIIVPKGEWELPMGAFKEGNCGSV